MSANDYQDIAEMRVTYKRCCNLKCAQFLTEDHVNKIVSRKFIILKGGHMQENNDPRVFCGKVSPNDKSKCEDAYNLQVQSIEVDSDSGPFNTSLDPVIEYLDGIQDEILLLEKLEQIK